LRAAEPKESGVEAREKRGGEKPAAKSARPSVRRVK
jgi:hypothetical protein